MASEFTLTRRVEFSETDMAGIMHFSNYYRFMEGAEHAFIRSLGLTIFEKTAAPAIGWPRVACSCEYKRPLKFEDLVDIHLTVAKKTEKAITYSFAFRKSGEPEICATGSVTVVCCTIREGRMQATFIPKEFAEKIDVHPG
ncbi:MAG TPA: thioesterase family protein [Planctomycetota bacterium]|nr:thioesterase family protein [Planctomycetota bacterium]